MSTANSASRKRAFIEEGDSENDKNVANKRFKTIQKSTVNVPPIFGDVNASNCFDHPCYGTIRYLSNAVVVKCNVCEKHNCIPCKAVHENQSCQEHKASILEVVDHEVMFDKLKEEGDVGDKKAGSSSGETQKEVDIHVTQLDTTQDADYTFKPENAEHSTPVGTTAENRKRLFDEEESKTINETPPPPTEGSIAQNSSKEEELEATYVEATATGFKFICRICPYSSEKKNNFGTHCKSKKHVNNSINYDRTGDLSSGFVRH